MQKDGAMTSKPDKSRETAAREDAKGFCRAYKFRLYPTPEQERYFDVNFRCTRFIYNHFLEARIKAYEATKETLDDGAPNPSYDPEARPLSFYDTCNMLTKLKKELIDESGHRWLYDADATALQQALRRLDKAYQDFFRRVRKGEKAGFPRFKNHDSKKSFTVSSCRIEDNRIVLPKAGAVKARVHRKVEGDIVSATIKKNAAGQYHASINVKNAPAASLPPNDNAVGIAMGVAEWVVTSDGEVFDNPKASQTLGKKLAREQKRLARMKKGSANYQKQKLKVARVYNKMANRREYETHSLTRQIVNENGVIASRDMSSQQMVQSQGSGNPKMPEMAKRRINRALNDANFYEINRQLAYKAEWAGRQFVLVPADEPTAQTCSSCGFKNTRLANSPCKTWQCSECGETHDRKFNGAKNVLRVGLGILQEEKSPETSGEESET